MDRSKKSDKSKHYEMGIKAGVGVTILAGVGFAFYAGFHHKTAKPAELQRDQQQVEKHEQAEVHGLWNRVAAAVDSTQEKAAEIQRALDENNRLRYENANLRLKLESVQFECNQKEAMAETKKIGMKVSDEAGSRIARTLASIGYKVPDNLLPGQLYTLGVTYFKAHENEKAAVILSFLTNLDGNTAFQTARNYLMTAVAWYRIDNFDMAKMYFEKVLHERDISENLPYQAQARLWQGLVAKHFASEKEVQYWLKDLIDHHPHSEEAEWINASKEEEREPATAKE